MSMNKDYKGSISVIDVMKDIRFLGLSEEETKKAVLSLCYCAMCGYPRPDITTLNSFKMYYIHRPYPDFTNMTEDEKKQYRFDWNIGFEGKTINLCKECMATVISSANREQASKSSWDELQTRRERIDYLLSWVNAHMDLFNQYHSLEFIDDQKYNRELDNYLKQYFVDKSLTIADIEE